MAADNHAEEKTVRFMEALTELSRQHGMGIAGQPILFLMVREDLDRTYKIDRESRLFFD
jgi:hypothetical protein